MRRVVDGGNRAAGRHADHNHRQERRRCRRLHFPNRSVALYREESFILSSIHSSIAFFSLLFLSVQNAALDVNIVHDLRVEVLRVSDSRNKTSSSLVCKLCV